MCSSAGVNETLYSNTMLANERFGHIHDCFLEHGWKQIENTHNVITYSKNGYETDYVRIKLENNFVFITVPIKQLSFVYITKFKDIVKALDYTEVRFKEYVDSSVYKYI